MTSSWENDNIRQELDRVLMELDYYRDKYVRMMEDMSQLKTDFIKALTRIQEERDK